MPVQKKSWNLLKAPRNYPMKGLRNLENVVYLGIIFPKESINDKKNSIEISSVW